VYSESRETLGLLYFLLDYKEEDERGEEDEKG